MIPDRKVPDHREIQRILVACKDKKPDFVGKNGWIGAIELSVVLDYLLGISCKILTCQMGQDVSEFNRQFVRHFETHGTPVMIGGL